jgi:hypothetical protein
VCLTKFENYQTLLNKISQASWAVFTTLVFLHNCFACQQITYFWWLKPRLILLRSSVRSLPLASEVHWQWKREVVWITTTLSSSFPQNKNKLSCFATQQTKPCFNGWSREYLRGKYHCTIDLLLDWFGLVCFANKNKNFKLSYSWFQTSQQEVNGTVILPPLEFPGWTLDSNT